MRLWIQIVINDISVCCFQRKQRLLLKQVHILCTDHRGELNDDFTIQEVNKFIVGMKNDKAIGCDGTPAEVQKTFVIKDGAKIFTKLFNMIRNKKSPKEWKLH